MKLSARWAHLPSLYPDNEIVMDCPLTHLHFRVLSGNAFVSHGIPSVSRSQGCRDRSAQWCNGVIIQRKSLFLCALLLLCATARALKLRSESRSRPTAQNSSFCQRGEPLQDKSMPKRATLLNNQVHGAKAALLTTTPSRRPTQQRGADTDTRGGGVKPAHG